MAGERILVLGGAGYIGSYVNKALHRAGYDTVVLDNLSHGDARTVTYGRFIQGDIGNVRDLERAFAAGPFAAVMHFAAYIDVGASVRNPAEYYRNNVCHTLTVLQTMLANGVPSFVFSSSAGIFGVPETERIDETHPCRPINPYGESKWMVERILDRFDHAYGLRSMSLRYFNAAGADPEGEIKVYPRKETNLIPILLRSLKNGGSQVSVFGTDYPTPDGTCVRDYIHIADLAQAHILALRKVLDGAESDQYNLGNGNGYSIREVIRAVEAVTGMELNIVDGPRREGDPARLVACAKKAEAELAWKCHYPDLETMIKHAWQALF